jgi:uncharacterized protein (DUF1330 family)
VSAYVIVEVEVNDPDAYEQYKPLAFESVAAHGGKYIARGGQVDSLEGAPPAGRVVVLEFPTVEAAQGWYHSDDYKEAAGLRHAAATSRLFIVDGG